MLVLDVHIIVVKELTIILLYFILIMKTVSFNKQNEIKIFQFEPIFNERLIYLNKYPNISIQISKIIFSSNKDDYININNITLFCNGKDNITKLVKHPNNNFVSNDIIKFDKKIILDDNKLFYIVIDKDEFIENDLNLELNIYDFLSGFNINIFYDLIYI